jgi:hypothetical protein
MDYLGCGVSPKETDTARLVVNGLDQVFHRKGYGVFEIPPVGPVLAEKAVEVAGTVEDRQVLVSIFRPGGIGKMGVSYIAAPRTDPCCTAIGREGVVIPVDDPLEAAGGDGDELSILIFVHATKTLSSRGDAALIEADRTESPISGTRRLRG